MSLGVKKGKSVCNDDVVTPTKIHGSREDGIELDACDHDKGSLRNNKLARRARSFKEDFLEKISQIRTPTNSLGRCQSPSNHRSKPHATTANIGTASSSPKPKATRDEMSELNYHVRQVKHALQHFRDVISKSKFEVLPGNGTVLLESIANVNNILQSPTLNVNRNSVTSAKTQLYLSLGKLIKLSDEVLTKDDDAYSASLSTENVIEIIDSVDIAIQNLVKSTSADIPENNSESNDSAASANDLLQLELGNMLKTSNFDISTQRTSLPDIPLTNRERHLIENENTSMRTFYSSDSILSDCVPPPKPPYPPRTFEAPPLPPKKETTPKEIKLEEQLDNLISGLIEYDTTDSVMFRKVFSKMQLQSSSSLDQDFTNVTFRSESHSGSAISPKFLLGSRRERRTNDTDESDEQTPPSLPAKTRGNIVYRAARSVSQYDNIREAKLFLNIVPQGSHHNFTDVETSHQSDDSDDNPPPLPVKKKYIMAYMEMFGNCSNAKSHGSSEFMRHTVHAYNINQTLPDYIMSSECSQYRQQFLRTCSKAINVEAKTPTFPETATPNNSLEDVPPALPPKKTHLVNHSKKLPDECKASNNIDIQDVNNKPNTSITPSSNGKSPNTRSPECIKPSLINTMFPDVDIEKMKNNDLENNLQISDSHIIDELDVEQYLVYKKHDEEGPDVKGGPADALIVYASKVHKISQNAFGEAFLTTFRTFITPAELIKKLTYRYFLFCYDMNKNTQKASKETFSLLVRVVNTLTSLDLTPQLSADISGFIYQLICAGELVMAKLLRSTLLEKLFSFKQQSWIPIKPILTSRAITTNLPTLLDLKSSNIAEQMTLLDAELFQKIEICEILMWAQEQCEERSPNLTRFTEHFNKMSYWARTQILKQEDARDREKYVIKFIKIMRHLRKINNYNSYLALLSALDSAPIRRLEWHRTITEGLKEYCALIDSSSSFRAYRHALAETSPPCIPYIGLVLQDLTFVHIGNQEFLSTGIVNFSKHWQQYNIVVNIKRFSKCLYPFKKNPRIIAFFDGFDHYLDEDAMWQISENIKPRMSRRLL